MGGFIMHVVTVNIPKINYDTINFYWKDSKEVPFFKRNSFYIKYQGIDIESIPMEYCWYAFLSIMIPVYSFCQEDVVFRFPSPVSTDIARLWINYHDAEDIIIEPLIKVNKDFEIKVNHKETNVGILFGGGKDSTYALSVLDEVYGTNNIVILSYVLPYIDNIMKKHDERRDAFLLNPLKEKMNVRIQKIYTNFYANLTKLDYKYSTHIAIYCGTLLPVLLHYKISLVTFSYEFLSYITGVYNSDELILYFKRSRPEYTEYISNITGRIINTQIDFVNFNYCISEIGSFKVIAERYPENLQNILMCENISEMKKWCLNCNKCGTYVLLSMCYGNKYMNIDINDFFENSGYINKLINRINNNIYERNEDNNYPWVEELCPAFHYESHCHIVASIDLEKYKKLLSAKAFNNLKIIKDKFGNKKYPVHESFIEPAFRKISPPVPQEVKEVATKHCLAIERLPEYFKIEDSKYIIDYSLRCDIPDVFKD